MNQTDAEPKWQPIDFRSRRVLGALIEKAKTTPDSYPLTLNALTNACNQKSNRDPQTNLTPEQVEETLEKLREIGAVTQVIGGGRVEKYRMHGYDWFGVSSQEIAILAELMLRGPQTVGELRGRAARMAPIADVSALRPLLESLQNKKLLIALTPAGRGQIVTHNLYPASELAEVTKEFGGKVETVSTGAEPAATPSADSSPAPAPSATTTPTATSPSPVATPTSAPASTSSSEVAELTEEVQELKRQLARLQSQIEEMQEEIEMLRRSS